MVRALKLALEDNMRRKIPLHHPVMEWLVEHAGSIVTKHHEDASGTTAYERMHGTPAREWICEFGETVV